jgi:hypothetical protein
MVMFVVKNVIQDLKEEVLVKLNVIRVMEKVRLNAQHVMVKVKSVLIAQAQVKWNAMIVLEMVKMIAQNVVVMLK